MRFVPRLFAASAGGNLNFRATKNAAGVSRINAGDRRCEAVESAFSGG
jgi:hypothetical protein